MMHTALFWFRRDLRFDDNIGLFHALKSGLAVLPVFIFDTNILHQLEDKRDKRVDLIHQRLNELNSELQKHGSALLVKYGNPVEILPALCEQFNVNQLFLNEDYEPDAIARDNEIRRMAASKNIAFHSFKDQVIFAKNEVLKPDGTPYSIFTAYSNKWKSLLSETTIPAYNSEALLDAFYKSNSFTIPSLAEIGFEATGVSWKAPSLSDDVLKNYSETRNFPALENGTSHFSVHLRFGTLSIRKMVQKALTTNEQFLNELIWREFFMMILYNFPKVVRHSFKPRYDEIKWRNNEAEFEKWCQGQTGYPLVDAGMRELNATGYMHNRVRMVVASFLIKHLLIDWRWGEAYFAQKLLDYDLAANNGNWQWTAGSGCDAAPYFRVFNPIEQLKKFDAQQQYVRRWVPEIDLPSYPTPIVEHSFARNRVLEEFKRALDSSGF
jgi:deoxyribodipyrimidine photo-lyase